MHTEKHQKNMKKEKLPSHVKEFIRENLQTPFKEDSVLKKWIVTHRLMRRQKILSMSMSWSTILAFLPLGLGFIHFFTTKTSPVHADSFFQKTVPLFANLHPKYTAETLQYICKVNSLTTAPKMAFLLSQPRFLADVKTQSSKKLKLTSFLDAKQFSGLSCSSSDILPSYIEGLNQSAKSPYESTLLKRHHKTRIEPFVTKFKNLSGPTTGIFEKEKQKSIRQNQTVNRQSYSFQVALDLISEPETLLQCISSSSQKSVTPLSVNNRFYKERLDFLRSEDELNREIQELFNEEEISLNLVDLEEDDQTSARLDSFVEKNSTLNEIVLVDKLLKTISKLECNQIDIPRFRLMSGYLYPDMTSQDLQWFFKQKQILQTFFGPLADSLSHVKKSSSFFLTPSPQYNFHIKNLPKFVIETKRGRVLDPLVQKSFYNGPTLLMDPEIAFDWKTSSYQNLRSWFHEYISPFNPFTQRHENFFGVFYSPKLSNKSTQRWLSEFHYNSLFQEVYITKHGEWTLVPNSFNKIISPSFSSFHIPNNISGHTTRLICGIEIPVPNDNETTAKELSLPVIQLHQPLGFKTTNSEKTSFNEKAHSPLFELGVTAKPDFSFSIDSWNFTHHTQNYSGSHYKRLASIFSQSVQIKTHWMNTWEPLSSNAWLIVTQVSFAVLIFHLVRNIAGNYGRELVAYLLELAAFLGFLDESAKEQIEIVLGQRTKGFRIISKITKTFRDVVGIEHFLPELYEVIWFLRNSGRDFALSQTLPRGILLTGPPGTGKTLLVQALAGEAGVPVIVLSGSSLIEPNESAVAKLDRVFHEARYNAPCIVFIDEIDTLGQTRSGIVENPMDQDNVLESIIASEQTKVHLPFVELEASSEHEKIQQPGISTNGGNSGSSSPQQLGLLTRLLIELDGMQGRDGIIVFGATNRPEALDPALLRPGRFDKILEVGLPQHDKRLEILQFYAQNRGSAKGLPWEYLAERTVGFSAADLATLMNESAMKSILTESQHTVETIEHGIDRLTTSEIEKISPRIIKQADGSEVLIPFSISQKLLIIRLAYYQAAKIVVTSLLEHHPMSVVACLWPRRPTLRSLQLTTNLQNSFFQFSRLCELHDRLVGCYAGKAAEFLFVQQFSSRRSVHLSTLGGEDLIFAQKLIYSLIEKGSFYSKKTHIQKTIQLMENVNLREFRLTPEKLDMYSDLVETIELPPMEKTIKEETSSLSSSKEPEFETVTEQLYYSIPWWQQETSNALKFLEKNVGNWSHIYLANPELNERNPEWVPPDEFYHTQSGLKYTRTAFLNVKRKPLTYSVVKSEEKEKIYPHQKVNFSWNEVSNLTKDYPIHSLVLQSFNKAFSILNQNRQLLDRLVIELISQEIVRQPEITMLLNEFQKGSKNFHHSSTQSQFALFGEKDPLIATFEKENHVKIIESSWGSVSRKSVPRWIDFSDWSNSENETT